MKRRVLMLPACLLLAVCSARAAQTENRGLYAVPPPGPVVIDGDLGDWDLSGSTLITYDVETLRDVYSADVAFMHDDESLYVSLRWKDPLPLGNSHDPQFSSGKGWAGDCVQLRFKTDRIAHLDAWYYKPKNETAVNIGYGRSLTDPFGGGGVAFRQADAAEYENAPGLAQAFKADADGKGYVQELRIPWSLIAENPEAVKAEGRIRCGVELLWGEADWPVHRYADNLAEGTTSREFFWSNHNAWGFVNLSPKGNLELPTPAWLVAKPGERPEGPVEIRYTLPKNARVTLAIDDAAGNRIRNLLPAAFREAGENVDRWDGLDDQGEVAPPGAYTVKGLYHDGLRLFYSGAFATPGNPPWQTADGKGAFYGDHSAPMAVAFAPDGSMGALACPMGEAGQHLIGVDAEGKRQWGLANRVAFGGGRIELATDGKTLWIANADENVDRYTIWRCDLATSAYSAWNRKDETGADVLDLLVADKNAVDNCRGLAFLPGRDGAARAGDFNRIVALLSADRKIAVFGADSGDILGTLENLPENVRGLAVEPAGTVLFADATALYRFDPDRDEPFVKIADRLEDPQGLAVAADGRIYVAQRGGRMNVSVHDATGKEIGEIGLRGGRPAFGFYNENAMLTPAGIALDNQGRLWVTEANLQPKRTSVWNLADGSLALDLPGTTAYAAGGIVNPYDPNRAISEAVEWVRDPATNTWKPFFTLGDAVGTGLSTILKFAKVDGREYIQGIGTARDSAMVKIFMRLPDGGWRHVAEFGNTGLGARPDEPYHAEWNKKFATPLFAGHHGAMFLWTDLNDDGKAAVEEMQFTEGLEVGRVYWGQIMGNNVEVLMPLRKNEDFRIFKPTGFTPAGAPDYDLNTFTDITPADGRGGEGSMALGGDNRIYVNGSPLRAIGAEGQTLWTYPSDYVSVHGSHHAPAARPGLLIGPSSIYGIVPVNDEVKEVFYLNGNLGQNFIFTDDGLWVQSLYNDCRGAYDVPAVATPGMSCDAMSAGGESFFGGFTRSTDGKFYTVGGGTGAVVMEVRGLESLARFGAAVTLRPEDIPAAQELKTRREAAQQALKTYTIARAAAPLAPDAGSEAWNPEKDGVEVVYGNNRMGNIKALYDDKNLYVAWRVRDNSPMKNAGQDDKLLFITGDAVDLMLRANPEADNAQPVAGDLRLLLVPRPEAPKAVLYRPVSPGAAENLKASFSSPWRTIPMDEVRTVEFPWTVSAAPDGYWVTAAIPLSLLGLAGDLSGKTLKGDFGILSSDANGRETTGRHYWSNRATNNTNDIPDEVILAPGLWGELRFE